MRKAGEGSGAVGLAAEHVLPSHDRGARNTNGTSEPSLRHMSGPMTHQAQGFLSSNYSKKKKGGCELLGPQHTRKLGIEAPDSKGVWMRPQQCPGVQSHTYPGSQLAFWRPLSQVAAA